MPRQPAATSACPATRARSGPHQVGAKPPRRSATSYGFPAKVKNIPMAHHCGRGEDAGPSEIYPTDP